MWPKSLCVELVHQRAEEPGRRLAELLHEIPAAAGPVDFLPGAAEHPRDLLVERVAVGDHRHAGLGDVFQDPLRQQDHDDALPAALGVPDDAALAPRDVPLGRLDAEILVGPGHLLHPAVEEDEIVHQLQQALRGAHPAQVFVELVAGVVPFVLLPPEEELLRGPGRAVAQALRIAAGEDQLDGGEKPLVELGALVGDQLADAVADAHPAVLQLDHADGDPVDVEHQIGPALVPALQGHLLGDGEVVVGGVLPVDQLHGFGGLPGLGFHRRPVAQKFVNLPVGVVEVPGGKRGPPAQDFQCPDDLAPGIAALLQIRLQQRLLDVAVALALEPIAQIPVAQLVAEQGDDPVLGGAFPLADAVHFRTSQ
jgi:hypothetical protein